MTGKEWQTKLKARQGIVYFSNYWQRQGETGSGTLATMGRYLGLREFLPGTDFGYSDLAGSDEILFWEIR